MDVVEGVFGEGPIALGVVDEELNVRGNPFGLDGGEVGADDFGGCTVATRKKVVSVWYWGMGREMGTRQSQWPRFQCRFRYRGLVGGCRGGRSITVHREGGGRCGASYQGYVELTLMLIEYTSGR